MKKNLRKVFPDHWSFMLGEIALWSFVVLLLTGVFLTLWFNPSMGHITYEGSYEQLRGVGMSESMASTLHISFDVRGGLLMRQMHHWAAMIFIASMMVHLLRVASPAPIASPASSTGSSAACCSCSAPSRDSPATRCLTTCCRAPVSALPTDS